MLGPPCQWTTTALATRNTARAALTREDRTGKESLAEIQSPAWATTVAIARLLGSERRYCSRISIYPLPFIQSLPHYFQNASISFSFFSISGPQQLKGKCLLYCYGSCSCCSWSCLRRGLIQASHCTECDSWARGLHATGGTFSSLSPESWSYRSAR